MPRFAFEKFPAANDRLTTQMKSVGEVMAIGRTFQESLQKALRGLETGHNGLNETGVGIEQLRHEIAVPGPERIFFLADGIRAGMTDEELHELSAIDPWFLNQVREIVETEDKLRGNPLSAFTKSDMLFLKRKGFSDGRLAQLLSLIHI